MTPTDARLNLRSHSGLWSVFKGAMFKKIPADFGAAEDNVVFGLGQQTTAGAGQVTLTVNATRDMVLRDLILTVVGNIDVNITSITAGGTALIQGGNVPATTFSFNNQHRPDFSYPIVGGTPVTIVANLSGAGSLGAAFAID